MTNSSWTLIRFVLHRLAKRAKEPVFGGVSRIDSGDWLKQINKEMPSRSNTQERMARRSPSGKTGGNYEILSGGKRDVRKLPFSRSRFEKIAERFHIHGDFARVVSRADFPALSCARVKMGKEAYEAYGEFLQPSQQIHSSLTLFGYVANVKKLDASYSLQLPYFQRLGYGPCFNSYSFPALWGYFCRHAGLLSSCRRRGDKTTVSGW